MGIQEEHEVIRRCRFVALPQVLFIVAVIPFLSALQDRLLVACHVLALVLLTCGVALALSTSVHMSMLGLLPFESATLVFTAAASIEEMSAGSGLFVYSLVGAAVSHAITNFSIGLKNTGDIFLAELGVAVIATIIAAQLGLSFSLPPLVTHNWTLQSNLVLAEFVCCLPCALQAMCLHLGLTTAEMDAVLRSFGMWLPVLEETVELHQAGDPLSPTRTLNSDDVKRLMQWSTGGAAFPAVQMLSDDGCLGQDGLLLLPVQSRGHGQGSKERVSKQTLEPVGGRLPILPEQTESPGEITDDDFLSPLFKKASLTGLAEHGRKVSSSTAEPDDLELATGSDSDF